MNKRVALLQQKPEVARPAKTAPVVQPKLAIGPSWDRYEQEADRLADRALAHGNTPAPAAAPGISRLTGNAVQRMSAGPPSQSDMKSKAKKVEDEEETAVQKSSSGPGVAPQRAEGAITQMRAAGGQKLAPNVRGGMERGLGTRLGDVRVHNNARSAQAAKDVGAHAFTVGRDVFFGAGQYQPATPAGQHLLAHELVHTEQQRGLGALAQTTEIQRAPAPADTSKDKEEERDFSPKPFSTRNNSGTFTPKPDGGGTIEFKHLRVPKIRGKYKGASDFAHPGVSAKGSPMGPEGFEFKGATARDTYASSEWAKNLFLTAAEGEIENSLVGLIPEKVKNWDDKHALNGPGGERIFYLKMDKERASNARKILFGTVEQLADSKSLKIPHWDEHGKKPSFGFDVDHSMELQLGGKDAFENFWLLNASANRSSGAKIANALEGDIGDGIAAIDKKGLFGDGGATKKPTYEGLAKGNQTGTWPVKFKGYKDLSIKSQKGAYWLASDIKEGKHLEHLEVMEHPQLIQEGIKTTDENGNPVTPDYVNLFFGAGGGFRRRFKVKKDGSVAPDGRADGFLGGFDFVSATVNPADIKTPYITNISGKAFRRKRGKALVDEQGNRYETMLGGEDGIQVSAMEGGGYSGLMDTGNLTRAIRALKPHVNNTSPITFEEGGINENGLLYATGCVLATKELLKGFNFPIHLLGTDIFIDFPVPFDKLSLGPATVTQASIRIGVGENGAFLMGMAALEVDQLGSGTVEARVEDGNTILAGTFNFDIDFLDKTEAGVEYNLADDTLKLTLYTAIGDGKLPGVSGGRFLATFSREAVTGNGEVTLKGPLSGTVVSMTYTKEDGLKLGADNIPLPVANIPGVKSAKASLYASRDPESGEWRFGGGLANLDIAGATGQVKVAVDGEKVVVHGNIKVAKGPATGEMSFTATNAPMDDEGNIIDGPPVDEYRVYGKGSATITFGEIIKGTAGIELTPEAGIILRGEIALAKDYPLFPKKDFTPNKPLLSLNSPEFPIFAVGVGPVSVGIKGRVGGSFSYTAYVGPGKLTNSKITAEMDLDKPDEAVVTGTTTFEMSAYAALILGVNVSLIARATALYARGTIGIDAEAGLRADASMQVDVGWSKAQGLEVDALGKASVQSVLVFTAWAELAAGVDYLGEKKWHLGERELGRFGPDLKMGLQVPAKWSEKEGLDFSLDNIVIDKPNLKGEALADEAGDRMF